MRIISQNGFYDLPYESCVIWVNKINNVMASPIGDPDPDYTIAIYSTQEKAEKAMQLLHEVCIVHENFKKHDTEIQLKILKKVEEKSN